MQVHGDHAVVARQPPQAIGNVGDSAAGIGAEGQVLMAHQDDRRERASGETGHQ